VADGIILNAILPTPDVERAIGLIDQGAQRAGRSAQDIDLAMIMIASPDADAAVGKNRARDFLAVYLSMFPNLARETGLEESFVESIRTTFNADGVEAAARKIDDSVVDLLCAAGSVEECRERLQAYRQTGVDLPILTPLDGTMELAIDELG
jgi:5,10-methylenetetrahydromethanopterin reductase